MTIKQLAKEVAHLGFESEIADTERLICSLNRALHIIYSDRPVIRTVKRYVDKIKPNYTVPIYEHTGEYESSFPLSGRAFSFISTGECSFRIKSGYREYEEHVYGEMTEYRAFIDGEATVTFLGEHPYTVLSLSSFDTSFGNQKNDIPIFGRERVIDIGEEFGDFMSFTEPVKDGRGLPIKGASLINGTVILPSDFYGEVNITYRRSARTYDGYSEYSSIDVPCEAEGLLPLLCASFIWLDDDADKAQYYMALYKDGMNSIKHSSTAVLKNEYLTNGWA